MDFLDRAISAGRFEDLDGTPVYSLVSGPDRLLALALKRTIDLAVGERHEGPILRRRDGRRLDRRTAYR